ncbi:MAG: c-type cytochrome [Campylobacterota bacterium]
MKAAKVFLAASLFAMAAYAQDSQPKECLCFEIEGKMGQELKALVEKYKGQLPEATVINSGGAAAGQGRFANFDLEASKEQETIDRAAEGKELYTRKCQSCHGKNGRVKAYNKSARLDTLSLSEFEHAIIEYKNGDRKGSTAFVMRPFADTLTTNDVKNIHAYLQSINNTQEKGE